MKYWKLGPEINMHFINMLKWDRSESKVDGLFMNRGLFWVTKDGLSRKYSCNLKMNHQHGVVLLKIRRTFSNTEIVNSGIFRGGNAEKSIFDWVISTRNFGWEIVKWYQNARWRCFSRLPRAPKRFYWFKMKLLKWSRRSRYLKVSNLEQKIYFSKRI